MYSPNEIRRLGKLNKFLELTGRAPEVLSLSKKLDVDTLRKWTKLLLLEKKLSLEDVKNEGETVREYLDRVMKVTLDETDRDKNPKESLFKDLKNLYETLNPEISYIYFADIGYIQSPRTPKFDLIEFWETLESHRKSEFRIPKSFSYVDNQVFIDFAAKNFGGGVFGRGWVQEESSISGMSVLPFVQKLNEIERNISENPLIVKTKVYFTPNPRVTRGKMKGAFTRRSTIKGDLSWVFTSEKPDGNPPEIFWATMVAIALFEGDRGQPTERYLKMINRAKETFEFSILYLLSKGLNEVVINTGNWGAGAFQWRIDIVHRIQMKVFRFLRLKYADLFPEVPLKLKYFSYDKKAEEKILETRTVWGFPGTIEFSQELLQDTIFFGTSGKIKESYSSRTITKEILVDLGEFSFLSNRYKFKNPIAFDLGDLFNINTLRGIIFEASYAETVMLLFNHLFLLERNVEFKKRDFKALRASALSSIDTFKKLEEKVDFDKKTRLGTGFRIFPNSSEIVYFKGIEEALFRIVRKKFSSEDLKEALLSTNDMILVDIDTLSKTAMTNPEVNGLGQFLMAVRKEKKIEGIIKSPKPFTTVVATFYNASDFFRSNSLQSYEVGVENGFDSYDIRYTLNDNLNYEFNSYLGGIFRKSYLLGLILQKKLEMCFIEYDRKKVAQSIVTGIDRLTQESRLIFFEKNPKWDERITISNGRFTRFNNMYIAYLVIKILKLLGEESKFIDEIASFYNPRLVDHVNFIEDFSLKLFE